MAVRLSNLDFKMQGHNESYLACEVKQFKAPSLPGLVRLESLELP